MTVIAVVPAHNEAASIADTIASLHRQTHRPDTICVVADNCTDDTGLIAVAAGATVLNTVGNTAKKAGALNQALDIVLPGLDDDDFVLAMDADSILVEHWLEHGIGYLTRGEADLVSGAYIARHEKGILPLFQRVEYAAERRRTHRHGGKVEVLSGTATLFPVHVLRAVAAARGDLVPGQPGQFYDSQSLTEDFELTLAVKRLGYRPRCFKDLTVVTDVMVTVRDLVRQRLRWQRGTLETLWMYKATRAGAAGWIKQSYVYLMSLSMPLVASVWVLVAVHHTLHQVRLAWLAVVPLFLVDQLVQAWASGRRGRLLAGAMVPMWIYDVFRNGIYWFALVKVVSATVFQRERRW